MSVLSFHHVSPRDGRGGWGEGKLRLSALAASGQLLSFKVVSLLPQPS